MSIVACSLGCLASNTAGGQIQCGVTDVYVNQEIRVTFSEPLRLSSVTNNTFQMVELEEPEPGGEPKPGGKTPPGSFSLDTKDPRVLIYRPLLTFDSSGNPIFGLTAGRDYELKIPGAALDKNGPYVESITGNVNGSRMLCTLTASRGLFDVKPGAPSHSMTVEQVVGGDPNNRRTVDARGATNVYRNTAIRIVFDDVMNPQVLANPVTGISPTITVSVDPDGNTLDPSDQVPVDGVFSITTDQREGIQTTTVLFTPRKGFPSSGSNLTSPRKIVVNLSPSIVDLGGNRLIQPGRTEFTIERIIFPTIGVDESFVSTTFEDAPHSGANWGNGELSIGRGGGTGRLGDLIIPAGEFVVLKTEDEFFDTGELTDPTIFNIENVIGGTTPGVPLVPDGIFEFARLVVETGATLRFEGPNPARVFVRGECLIQGEIDSSAMSSSIHDPISYTGGVASSAGPGGGLGGAGGVRPDGENFTSLGLSLDNPLPNAGPVGAAEVHDPANYAPNNGVAGSGIPIPGTGTFVAGGGGGLAWPQPGALPPPPPGGFEQHLIHFPEDKADSGATSPSPFAFSPKSECAIRAPGGVGAGGSYALDGFQGKTTFASPDPPPLPPEAKPGNSLDLALDAEARSLDPEKGFLRGGSGGGGGGGHLFGTKVNAFPFRADCLDPLPGTPLEIDVFNCWSGAAGGSGGGAIQLQCGRRLLMQGTMTVRGGNGGSGKGVDVTQPGGGGSGGSILLQSPSLLVQATTRRLTIGGGDGGQNFLSSVGGNGGPGLVRLEDVSGPIFAAEATKISPTESEFKAIYGPSFSMDQVLSVGIFDVPTEGPAARNGSQSCWFTERDLVDPANPAERVENFFQLAFTADSPTELGWDMTVRVKGLGSHSFRGPNTLPLGGMSIEEALTTTLGVSPVVVRFQGAHSIETISQPCAVPLTGTDSPILLGSLTPWVPHPHDLSLVFASDPSLTPNIFRFAVIWDASITGAPVEIEAIESILVKVTPD